MNTFKTLAASVALSLSLVLASSAAFAGEKGAGKIPTFSKADRENLATVVADPVNTSGIDGVVTPTVSWVSLLIALALWLGALATFAVIKPLDGRLALSTASSATLIGRALLPGVIVAAAQAADDAREKRLSEIRSEIAAEEQQTERGRDRQGVLESHGVRRINEGAYRDRPRGALAEVDHDSATSAAASALRSAARI